MTKLIVAFLNFAKAPQKRNVSQKISISIVTLRVCSMTDVKVALKPATFHKI